MPESTGPLQLEEHLANGAASLGERGTRTEHSRSLPTHGMKLGEL